MYRGSTATDLSFYRLNLLFTVVLWSPNQLVLHINPNTCSLYLQYNSERIYEFQYASFYNDKPTSWCAQGALRSGCFCNIMPKIIIFTVGQHLIIQESIKWQQPIICHKKSPRLKFLKNMEYHMLICKTFCKCSQS